MLASKLQPLKDRYNQLAPREQKAVLIGGIFVLVFIVYSLILSPISEHAVNLRKQITTQQSLLTWMQATDKNIQSMAGGDQVKLKAVNPVTLMSTLQMQIKHDGLASTMTELKQTSTDSVNLHFKKASFDNVMRLVMLVLQKQKVSITQFSATSAGKPGITDVNIVFKTAE